GSSYTWSTGAVTQTINVNAAGIYWVDVNLNGCHDTDTIIVQQFLPPQIGNDTLVCEGQNVPLNGGIGQSWLWSTGAVTQNISVNTSGSYWVETTNGPCVKRDTIVVTVQQLPIVDVGPDSVLCPNSSYTLNAGNPGASYLWSTGDVTQSILVNTAGTYTVVVTMNGCPGSDTVIIQTTSPVGLEDEASLCDVLDIELDAGNPGSTYIWNTGATTQSIIVNAAGEYYVLVNNGFCEIRDTIQVTGSPGEGALFVPNTFTPNSNDLNERFYAKGEGVVDFQMRIFDRWGNLIFETNNINDGWDGKVKDQVSQIDTYVYVINYTTLCSEGKRLMKHGHVNIIR
ncbi:MAG: gliding motility-associated C-terminal domain-containing protein, partial [Bacteroidia bacterium]